MTQWEPPAAGSLRIFNPKTIRAWKASGEWQEMLNEGYIYAIGCGRFRKELCECSKCGKMGKIPIDRKDFYEFDKPRGRIRKRLMELNAMGLSEVGIAQFGVPGVVSGLYIERVWSDTNSDWADYLKWMKSAILNKKTHE